MGVKREAFLEEGLNKNFYLCTVVSQMIGAMATQKTTPTPFTTTPAHCLYPKKSTPPQLYPNSPCHMQYPLSYSP